MDTYHRHCGSPKEAFESFWRNRDLIWQLTKRDVVGRYRGSLLGIAWSFFNPVLMLAVYTFVFSVVFKARWGGGGDENRINFAIVLFVGMIVHGLFSECVNRAPGLIVSNVSYVKRVVFPLEILPWISMGSALFHAGINLLVLILAQLILMQQFPLTIVLAPFVVMPLVFATMGLTWFLAAIGVYVRDVGQTTGVVTTILLFLAPVFYPISALPERYRGWLHLNPLTFIIEEGRKVLVFGDLPNWGGWIAYFAVSFVIAGAGFWWFQRTRRGFADVL